MADNVDDIIGKEALKQVDNLEKKLKQADLAMLALSARALELNRNLQNITVPSNLAQLTSQNAQLTAQIQAQAAALNALQTQYSTLTRQRQQSSQRTAEESVNQGILNRNATESVRINSALVGAYGRLSAQQNQASRRLQDLIVGGKQATQTQREYDIELRNAQKEFTQLNTRVTAADKAVGRFNRNVGNYPMQAAKGIKDLIGAFGVLGGLALGASIVKNIFETSKELQSLNLALLSVTGSQQEFAKQQLFLQGISQKYGLELKGLTEQFVSFYVSAKGKLAGKEIQEVFENISKSGSALGLSNDALKRSFMALNQMLSKGKVASEELRGQLAEAMPGAVQAMTKAVQKLHPEIKNLTEKGLFEMIKNGKILAEEVLPETSRQLLILTGADKATAIDTLTKTTNRLVNSWTKMIQSINESDSSGFAGFVKSIVGGLTTILDFTGLLFKDEKQLETYFQNIGKTQGLEEYNAVLENISTTSKEQQEATIKALIEKERQSITTNLKIVASEKEKRASIIGGDRALLHLQTKNEEDALVKIGKSSAILKAISESRLEADKKVSTEVTKLTKEEIKALEDAAKARYDSAKKEIEFKIFLQQNILDNELSSYKDQYIALQKSLALKLMLIQLDYNEQVRLAKGNSDKIRVAELDRKTSLIKQEQEGFAKLKSIRKSETADQLNEIKAVNDASEKYQDDKDNRLKESLELNQKITQAENDLVDSKIAKQKELKDGTKNYLQSFTEEFMANSGFGETFDTFFKQIDDGTGHMTTNFAQLLKGAENSKEKFAVYFNAIAQSAQEAFAFITQATEKNFSDEKKTLQDQYDVSLKYAGDNKEAQEKLALDLENKKKAIANREAKAKQEQAIFNIAIDTAQAIVSLWVNPGFPSAIPLAILVGSLGVAQAVAVASQEIPQYYMGGTHDGGLMMVNDALGSSYKETIVTPDGKVSKPQGRNVLMNAPAGTEIYTPEQWDSLQGMLKGRGVEMYQNISTSNGMTKEEMYEVMNNTLGNQPNHSTNFDENGVYKYIDKRGNRTKQNIARGNGRGIKN